MHLDETHFVDCTLNNCTLVYFGGEVTLERTAFQGCRLLFDHASGRTVQLLQSLGYLPQGLDFVEVHSSAVH